ncbi:YncE family protein [Bradyrhizobium sp. dw_411]|uniref:YncE family protein n=1 Tax=Bradyrhizobium sp. dw_411 TaxID=2720082 RepID=UPI001BD0CB9A|nr:YncE family protein [Bradyrhizobium sp. dw_411]
MRAIGHGLLFIILTTLPALGGPQHILIGMDETSTFGDAGQTFSAPGNDTLVVMDTSNPAHPTLGAPVPMSNSVYGPPVNLQITPDGSLGLVASSVLPVQKDGKWVNGPDNTLHLIDLTTMQKLDDVKVGDQPHGVAISRDGKRVVIANRTSKDVNVLSIDGKSLKPIATVALGDAAVAAAVTPDGKRAFVVKNGLGRVAVLSLDDDKVGYDSTMDIPTGANPYNLALTPDGSLGFVVNNGVRGHNGSVTVFEARGPHPRVIDTLAIGDGPEGFAMAPDGKSAVVILLHGSTSGPSEWPYHANGGAAIIAIENGKARILPGEVKLGGVPEGVAYSRDSKYVYVGDFTDKVLHILRAGSKGLVETGTMKLPGHPASIRGPAF